MTTLTDSQIAALRWMRDFPSDRAEWLVNGRRPRKVDDMRRVKLNMMELRGPRGSIRIPLEDWQALHGLFIGCPTPDKIYGPNEEGLRVLST